MRLKVAVGLASVAVVATLAAGAIVLARGGGTPSPAPDVEPVESRAEDAASPEPAVATEGVSPDLECPPGDPIPSETVLYAPVKGPPMSPEEGLDRWLRVNDLAGLAAGDFIRLTSPAEADATGRQLWVFVDDGKTVALAEFGRFRNGSWLVTGFTACLAFEQQHRSAAP